MSKKRKNGTTRAERQALYAAKQKAEEQELQEVEDPALSGEALPDEVIPDEPETIEKDMDEMYMGPTSYEEMDAMEEAREQAAKVQKVTYETQEIVWNILNHSMKSPEEKATAIQAVGAGFGARVSQAAKPVKKDLDVLVIEAILAADKRRTGPLEHVKDWITKAVLSGEARESLSDEQFALVVTRDGKKVRKYPIHDKAHVRNALARAAQQNDADAHAAMPKIRAAAKRMGIEMSMEKDRNAIVIEKDVNGDWRWVGWVSNNFIDWDGDIMSEAAHVEYVGWLEKNMEYAPLSTTWHLPELVRKSTVDFATYENGFLIMSGKLTEEEAENLLKAMALTDLGMSHGTFVLERDKKDPRVITRYRMYECSDLPLENAANPFTNFELVSKEVDMDKEKYLAPFFGGDVEKAKAFLEKTGLKQKALQDAGIESKEKTEETPEVPPSPTEPVAQAAQPDTKAILEALKKELGMEELSETVAQLMEAAEKVPVLEALVKEMQGNQDEKLAEILTPPASRYAWMQKARATESEDNVAKDEEEKTLKQKAPGVPEGYWLSEVTGTTPVQVQ